jgi:hypothetical protein
MYNTDLPRRAELPSTGKLLRSTFVAALIAAALLVLIVLPAEYGIDATGAGRIFGFTQMGEIKRSLAAQNAAEAAKAVSAPVPLPVPTPTQPPQTQQPAARSQQHNMVVRLKPGQAAEIKLSMRKGARVQYEWSSAGGTVNYDTHGDPAGGAPKGFYHGYGKGRGTERDAGTLEAAFDGTHGWFWRNRSKEEVTVTLKTSGDYNKIDRVL